MTNEQKAQVTIDEAEYQTLLLIEDAAKGLLARYPFDSPEKMKPRWKWLGSLIGQRIHDEEVKQDGV